MQQNQLMMAALIGSLFGGGCDRPEPATEPAKLSMITANADAKTALQASMNAYSGAPLAFMVTHVLARGQDELTREETIVSRVDDEFEWLGSGFRMESTNGHLLAQLDVVPDRVVDVPVSESLLNSIESVLADSAPVPAILIAWQGGSYTQWLASLTGGLLYQAIPIGMSVQEDGSIAIDLSDRYAHATVVLDANNHHVRSVHATRRAVPGEVGSAAVAYAASYAAVAVNSVPDEPISLVNRRVVTDIAALQADVVERVYVGVGDQAPDFVLPMIGGGEVSLESLRGKIVLLDFWATWCVPCRAGLPDIDKIYQATGRNAADVRVFGVNVMEGNSSEERRMAVVEKFWTGEPVFFPTLVALTNELTRAWGIGGIPTTVIIGPDGTVLERVDRFTIGEWKHLLEVIERASPGATQQP
ncbi:MAG: TlpA disulfide reductase family protein [Phycisphaerales bacterium]|nr:TlpA disulfide reductase family protein [Phycisphaerales bacterium]